MEDLGEIIRELDELERIQAELGEISSRKDDLRRHDMIKLRRQLSGQIAAVAKATDPVFTAIGDAETVRTYRAKFSKMRSSAALHQAGWPAVMLGERPDEYRASAAAVREASRDFVTWTRDRLRAFQK